MYNLNVNLFMISLGNVCLGACMVRSCCTSVTLTVALGGDTLSWHARTTAAASICT